MIGFARGLAFVALAGLLALGAAGPGPSGRVDGAGAAGAAPASAEAADFDWPLPPPVQIARAFDLPAEPWLAGHRGVDLTAGQGAVVLAPAAGVVSFNGWIVDRHVLVIRHGELASTLEPVLCDLQVGDPVAQGEAVGTVAAEEAGHCPGCLHWGVRRGEDYLDPAGLVEPRPRAVLWE